MKTFIRKFQAVSCPLLMGLLLIGASPKLAMAADELPPVAALEGAAKTAFLNALSNAVKENPSQAGALGKAAINDQIENIKQAPGLAVEIAITVFSALPNEYLTLENIVAILDELGAALTAGLPPDQQYIGRDVAEAVLALLPPDLAQSVRNEILLGAEGSLREYPFYNLSVPPSSGPSPTPKKKKEKKEKKEKKPEEPPVTPTMPSMTPSIEG